MSHSIIVVRIKIEIADHRIIGSTVILNHGLLFLEDCGVGIGIWLDFWLESVQETFVHALIRVFHCRYRMNRVFCFIWTSFMDRLGRLRHIKGPLY